MAERKVARWRIKFEKDNSRCEIKDGYIIGRREMDFDTGDCGPADGHEETMAEERARLAREKAEADREPLVRIPVHKAYG